MTISKFNSSNINQVSDEMMIALKEVGDKFGVKFGRKGIRYSEGDFRVTITVKVSNPEEGVLTKEESQYNYEQLLTRHNTNPLPELGSSFISGSSGKKLTIVGWNTRARKYPIMLKDENGKGYKDSASHIRTVTFI